MAEVTDPAILAQLNGTATPQAPTQPQPTAGGKEVTDPAILAQLNGTADLPPSTKPHQPMKQTAIKGAIGGGTAVAVMPWALIGGGALLETTGIGAPVGLAMQAAGADMLAVQTASAGAAIATMAGGAALGALSAPAGQKAEEAATARGASPATAGAIGAGSELAVGVAAGGAWGLAKSVALDSVPAFFKPVMKGFHALTKVGAEAGDTVSAAVEKAQAKLMDPVLKEQPQHTLHNTLQTAADAHSKAAEKAATGIEQKAQQEAQALLAQGQAKAQAATAQGMAEAAKVKAAGGKTAAELRAQGEGKAGVQKATAAENASRIEAQHKAQAQALLDKAHADAAAIRKDAAQRQEVLNKASEGKAKTAAAVTKMAAPKLLAVGEAKPPSVIGEPLQETIGKQKAQADEVRKATDEKLRSERDQVVATKEQKGDFIDQTPEYKGLRAKIAARIQNTVAGRKASTITTEGGEEVGLTRTGDPGVESGWQRVWNAINSKTVTWVDAEGNEQSQTFRTTHEALDNVRRKLGDAAYGKEAEGYGALGQKQAKELYEDISNVQKAYAGESQTKLQENYTAQLEAGEKFKTRMGRLALDDDKSPAAIPKVFFRDQNGVRDLKELTGNPAQVETAGREYLAGKLQGKSAAQVKAYLDDINNKDWLKELPGVQAKAEQYLKDLTKAEQLMAGRTAAAERLTKEAAVLKKTGEGEMTAAEKAARKLEGTAKGQAKALEKTGQGVAKKELSAGERSAALEKRVAENAAKAAEAAAQKQAQQVAGQAKAQAKAAEAAVKPQAGQVVKTAQQQAKQLRADATAKVEAMTKSGTAVETVESLINSEKDLSKLVEVGKVLHGVPGGKQMWADSVARVVTKKSPGQLGNWWETRGRDVAKAGGATAQQIAELDAGVEGILKAANPKVADAMKKRLATTMARAMGAVMGAGVSARLPSGDSED